MSATCTRPGCGKTLRSNNTKGVCGSGCLSPDAPASHRTTSAKRASPKVSARVPDFGALDRFRTVAEALGKNPEAILSEFAEGWLQALRDQVDQ